MIEVSLYAIPADEVSSKVGRCIARNRFDKEGMGVSIEEFVRGFLKDNLEKFETRVGNEELTTLLNSPTVRMTRKDIVCINHILGKSGFIVKIFNVADDEDNSTGVPGGEVSEWNIIDKHYLQYDYPTATKILPGDPSDIPGILEEVVHQSGLFASGKFDGIKNPFDELITGLKNIKKVSGSVNASLVTRIYTLLDELGIEVFIAASED